MVPTWSQHVQTRTWAVLLFFYGVRPLLVAPSSGPCCLQRGPLVEVGCVQGPTTQLGFGHFSTGMSKMWSKSHLPASTRCTFLPQRHCNTLDQLYLITKPCLITLLLDHQHCNTRSPSQQMRVTSTPHNQPWSVSSDVSLSLFHYVKTRPVTTVEVPKRLIPHALLMLLAAAAGGAGGPHGELWSKTQVGWGQDFVVNTFYCPWMNDYCLGCLVLQCSISLWPREKNNNNKKMCQQHAVFRLKRIEEKKYNYNRVRINWKQV